MSNLARTTRWLAAAVVGIGLPALGASCDKPATTSGDPPDEGLEKLECEVVIVGGGAAGLHTAFRLAPELGHGVCLFEKEAELGGRIHDVALDEEDPESPRFGTGARRVMEGQQVLFDLAAELGLELETPAVEADLVEARGVFGLSKEEVLSAYPTVDPDADGDTETAFYDAIRLGPARENVANYPDLRAYIRDTLGFEEFNFLHDVSRFRADFEYPLDARGYLDYLDEEWDVCCTPSYPVGGMSAFIRGMESSAAIAGARIYKSEPVSSISRIDGAYRIVTDKHLVTAEKVVIAAPPQAMQYITGDVADDIKEQPQFQQLIGVEVVTVTQWWPERWWADIANPDLGDEGNIWRAWTTNHCLNFIEIPLEPYGVEQKVTRSVYDDDVNCVQFWKELYAQGGTEAVDAEIKIGLQYLFDGNGLTEPMTVNIPDPIKTHVQIWPAAWYWLAANSDFTNADIFEWATEPLAGEDVGLVGEGYNPQRSGWSDGAYKSSINLLDKRYGQGLDGLPRKGKSHHPLPGSPAPRPRPGSWAPRSSGGN